MSATANDAVRAAVRETYSQIAGSASAGSASAGSASAGSASAGSASAGSDGGGCCSPSASSCCDTSSPAQLDSTMFGYSHDDLAAVPDGADLGLGCGNPGAIAAMKSGETVLDLGSGAGFDAFLAARAVGPNGRVIGVDMTPTMVSKARANAEKGGYDNVDFRLGEIEHLPIADGTVDVVISNCVINLSPDKAAVFADTYRVLRPGGRLAISDVVASAELPDEIRNDVGLYSGCMAGASLISDIHKMLLDAGFDDIVIAPKDESKSFIEQWAPGRSITDYVVSATIQAAKPAVRAGCC